MGRKKKVEPDDPAQFARFIEASEKIDFVENPKEAFEKAFKKVAKPRPAKTHETGKPNGPSDA